MADMDIQLAVRETLSLLDKDDLFKAVAGYKADSEEKEIAAEYVKAYSHFLKDVADHDTAASRSRADYELRELVGHINAMLKHKQPDIFMKMLLNCPKHYAVLMGKGAPAKTEEKPSAKKAAPAAKPTTKQAPKKK